MACVTRRRERISTAVDRHDPEKSTPNAEAFCRSSAGPATALPAFPDRDGNRVAAAIADLNPDIMVDAAGPFQAYGGVPYRIVEASPALGVD
ncbi:MAG: hypothetical protein FWD68_07695 [Alphaproteobacteria bacterium]|nr:hypothetical protein [Alphaproteobacteria bacterium]